MKTVLIVIACILISAGITSAQSNYQITESLEFFRSQLQSDNWKDMLAESNIEGSPYLNDEFINGTIFTTSKMQFQNIPLRYNIYNDNLEFKTPENKVMGIAAPEIIERVEFGEFKLVYLPYSILKKINRGFFKELVFNHVSLYSKAEIAYEKATEPAAYQDAKPAKFLERPNTYFLRIEKEAAILITNKKELIELFPKYHNEVETYIKKNKIKIKNEDQLVDLVNYYNSLLKE